MIQLIKKDIVTQRSFAYLAPLFLLPYFLTFGKNFDDTQIIGVLAFSMSIAFIAYFMVMYSNLNTNEGEKVQIRLLLSLPINRTEIIIAKYATILIWWLISLASYIILFFIAERVFKLGMGGSLDLRIIPLSFCFTYILSSIFYPLQFKFGYRVASFLGILMFFAITSSVGKIFNHSSSLSFFMEKPILSIVIFALLISLLSFFVSLSIFSKKDY